VYLFSANIHAVPLYMIVKTVMSNFECVKYSSLLNTLKGICFNDEQYAYCTNSRGTKARSWSCHSGLDLDLGLVVLVLVLRIWSCSHHCSKAWVRYPIRIPYSNYGPILHLFREKPKYWQKISKSLCFIPPAFDALVRWPPSLYYHIFGV